MDDLQTPVNGLHFGRLAPAFDPRTLRMESYAGPNLRPPPVCRWSKKADADWKMFANDRMGCCTCASLGHAIQVWSANATSEIEVPEDAVIRAYSEVTGYDPVTGANDRGANMLQVLKYFRRTGIAGRKAVAFVSIDPDNKTLLDIATCLFGGVYFGVILPRVAMQQHAQGRPWTAPVNPWVARFRPEWQPIGGHAVFSPDYEQGGRTCITWGKPQKMTDAYVSVFAEEAWAIVGVDWFNKAKMAPNGFKYDKLMADLQTLGPAS